MGGWGRPLAACVAAIVASPSHPATTPPCYSRDAAWPLLPPSVRLEGTTGVAVSTDGEVFVANHDTPRVMVLSERNGTLLRTWGDDELDYPHGLRIAPAAAHRSLLPPLIDRGLGIGAAWSALAAAPRVTQDWPASLARPALELADGGPSTGISTTVSTVVGVSYALEVDVFTQSLAEVEGVFVNGMAYIQPGEHVPITSMAQISSWSYPSARPSQVGAWHTITLSFVASAVRTTIVLHGEGSDTAWFRNARLTFTGPLIWLTDMGAGPRGAEFGRSVYIYDRLGHRLGSLGAAATGTAAVELGHVADVAWTKDGRTMLLADGDGGPYDHVLVSRPSWGADGRLQLGELRVFGERGTAPGQLNNTHGLGVDRCNRVWVSNRANSRVDVFDLDGELLATWGAECWPRPGDSPLPQPFSTWFLPDSSHVAVATGGPAGPNRVLIMPYESDCQRPEVLGECRVSQSLPADDGASGHCTIVMLSRFAVLSVSLTLKASLFQT